jgi:hypothetical protein
MEMHVRVVEFQGLLKGEKPIDWKPAPWRAKWRRGETTYSSIVLRNEDWAVVPLATIEPLPQPLKGKCLYMPTDMRPIMLGIDSGRRPIAVIIEVLLASHPLLPDDSVPWHFKIEMSTDQNEIRCTRVDSR